MRPVPDGASHSVQYDEGAAFLSRALAQFVGAGLGVGQAAVVIATPERLSALEAALRTQGCDLARTRADGRYLDMDATDLLAQLLLGGRADPTRFEAVVEKPIRALLERHGRPVRAFAELGALLGAEGSPEAGTKLEALWSELAGRLGLAVLCAYPSGAFARTGESLSRLAAIVESSEDAIVGKTLDGIVTSWNEAAQRMFGYRAEEMIGQSISRIIPPERRGDFPRVLETIRRGERVAHFETERLRKDGRRIHVSITVSPIRDETGRLIGASKIARDVTERKRLEAEREQLLGIAQRACAEAEAANRTKDEFLATLSHELRNPLSALRNAVSSARLGGRDAERALEIASRQAEQLTRLIDDLLDVSRIAHGRVRLNRRRIPLRELLERAVETTRWLAQDREQRIGLSLPPDSAVVDGDPLRLEQVVVNLIGNAVKHASRGGSIAVSGEQDGNEAVIRVRDDGPGIAPELLPHIFDLFVQGRPPGTTSGLGIGLTLVRSLVALHGGRVEARSEGLGKGAEFVVHLPRAATGELAAAAQAPALGREPGGEVMQVLVVEDNSDAAESMMMLIEVFGHGVRVAADGESALELARSQVPDLMLVDIGLPGIDGYEVARRVRQTPELKSVTMIALTGYGREEDRDRALAAGFDRHLLKPVDPDALRRMLGGVAAGISRPT